MSVKRLFVIITVLLSLLLPSLSQAQQKQPKAALIPDANLAAAVRQEIGNSITTRTLLNLKRLVAPNRGIKRLAGLEHARNLEELNLGGEYIEEERRNSYDNAISNISPIKGLTRLTLLDLAGNNVSDISALSGLTRLMNLRLYNNPISDISPLSGLSQLTFLELSGTSVSDVSALSGLTQLAGLSIANTSISDVSALATLTHLTYLDLGNSSISDISPLANLTQLTTLYLWGNAISDISALSGLTQLTTLGLSSNDILDVSPLVRLNLQGTKWNSTGLYIEWNPLSYASINRHIPAMQAKGVEIKFTNRVPMTLTKVLGIAQQGIINTTLPLPFVVEVLDAEGRAFADVPVKFAVAAGGGKLSATTVRTDATGKAAAHLRMRRTAGTTTVRVTAAKISQPVQFTATAILRSAPVAIPDINLRAKIAETLGKPLDGRLTAADMLTLKTLTANNANILDLTGLQHAANLTTLSFNNNSISNVSPLAGLTKLKRLDLRNNRISDVSPLVRLTQSRGPKGWEALYLQGNPLSDTSIRSHIRMLQSAGVNVRFDGISKQSRPIVRLVYFLPRDRQPQPHINVKMDRLIKDVQQLYEKQMENRGFGRKTFQFEIDAHGNAVVYHINGRFDDRYYHDVSDVVWKEINEQFDRSRDVYLTALDISTEMISIGKDAAACGTGGGGSRSGGVLIPASGHCFNISTAAHELGHAFGLMHDFSNNTYLMAYGSQSTLSQCAAEWLDVHRAFSPNQITSDEWATIEMLPPSLASPPNAIRFRFKVNEPDGLHQVQLYTQTLSGLAKDQLELVAYKRLNGNSNNTVNLVTSYLVPKNKSVTLRVIDVHGNIAGSEAFPVDIASLLPRSRVVSIRDANLASAIREEIGNSITTHTLLNLTRLDARNRGITNLAGLQHAHNLRELDLGGEYIDGKGYVNSNAISNLGPLTKLTNLNTLNLADCSPSDVSFLARLTQLTSLNISNNPITDVSPVMELTQLTELNLSSTLISDVSPLAGLTQLRSLYLHGTSISDVSALSSLTQLRSLGISGTSTSDISPLEGLVQLTDLSLNNNSISNISPLAGLRQLKSLYLGGNSISDISVLSGLPQLTYLHLSGNAISDISALSGLTQLIELRLPRNAISDISALSGLPQLTRLDLVYNDISDVSPLVGLDLTGTEWDSTGLFIDRNPLSYTSINTHIPAMQAKGIEVKYDPRTPTTLVKISGTAQQGIVNSKLPLPFVVEVRDERNLVFAGVPVKFAITAGRGRLSNTTVTTDTTGRAAVRLTLGRTAGTTAVRVTARKISQSVEFTAVAILLSAPVAVTDEALRTEILSALGNRSRDETLTVSDMLKLTTLTANRANIRDLTGLQHASNLTALSLNNNNLSDIASIAGLSQLTTLSLNGNRISDVTPLAALKQLKTLSLENNNLSDVTSLSGSTQLTTLLLDDNRLSDVVPLTGLSKLRRLSLNNNDLSDVAPLISLTQLKTLQLKGNLLSYPSLHTHVPAIQARGATVAVDLRTPTTLVKVSGTHGVAGTALPVIVEVQDEQGLGFSGVPVTFTVTTGSGNLSTSKVITDITGRARTTLTLGATPGKNTVRTIAVEVRRPALFAITAINANSRVAIRDANLRAKVAQALSKPTGAQLTAGAMLTLEELKAPNANIQDLTGLEHAHNLKELYLGGEYIEGKGTVNSNTISDFSPIAGLTQLTRLDLSFAVVSDASFLSGLTQLKTLHLHNNPVSDISALVGLTQLTSLELSSTAVSDLSPLAGLTQLRGLYLYNTSISDVSALSGLTELTGLGIGGTSVSDVSPLAALTQLAHLHLGWNAISDISALARLTQLKSLTLSGNIITDVSALSGLTQLTTLNLRNNAIMDVSPLVGLDLKGTQWNSTGLSIEGNPLNYASVHTHIPAMQAKGVEVRFDNRAHSALVKISGDTQEGEARTTLVNSFVVEALDEHGVPITELSVTFRVVEGNGSLSPTTAITDTVGRAQTTLMLGPNPGVIKIRVTAARITYPVTFTAIATEVTRLAADVNGDGVVNIQDLVLVSSNFGQTGQNRADVNGDGVVNISDLVLVAGAFGGGVAAAPTLHLSDLEGLTAAEVQDLLTQARQMALTDPAYLRGIAVLEQLLMLLLPKETALLANYPNPFNPETWIPYQLAESVEVTLHIYTVNGVLVRTLALGYQPVGMYHNRSRAVYWDGRNALGEVVASGIYFYTLTAGDFTATRKLLIRK